MNRIGEYRETSSRAADLPSIREALETPLEEEDRALLGQYLRKCHTLAATTSGFTDAISGKEVRRSKNLHTNGVNIWTEDLAHYVETYGLNPGHDILKQARDGLGLNMSQAEKDAAREAYWKMPRG